MEPRSVRGSFFHQEIWDAPDQGQWKSRGEPRHVYSKVMAWPSTILCRAKAAANSKTRNARKAERSTRPESPGGQPRRLRAGLGSFTLISPLFPVSGGRVIIRLPRCDSRDAPILVVDHLEDDFGSVEDAALPWRSHPMSLSRTGMVDRIIFRCHYTRVGSSLLHHDRFKLDKRGPPISDWRAHILRMLRRVRVRR